MNMITKNKVLLASAAVCLALGSTLAGASSHREAPFITQNPKVDATDFYVFRSYEPGREPYVTLIANYIPLQDPQAGPNYFSMDPKALYEIHIDNNGDALEDITFQFRFNNELANNGNGLALPIGPAGAKTTVAVPLKNIGPISSGNTDNLNFMESYSVKMVNGDRRSGTKTNVTKVSDGSEIFGKPFDYIGNKTYTDAASYKIYADDFIYDVNIPNCGTGKIFVGQRKESFSINIGEVFDLVNFVPVEGDSAPGAGDGLGFPGGITQDPANNDLRGKNITTIALELPISCIATGGDTIGAWTSASLRQARVLNPDPTFKKPSITGGAWTQISRLGSPLVNELVIGLKDKNRFNSSEPKDDANRFATYVTHPTLPAILDLLFNSAVNNALNLTGANKILDLAPSNFPRNDLVAAFLKGFTGVNANGSVAEMLRLNTSIAVTPKGSQSTFGVAGGDLAGFPNGRRPGDDAVDIALRVMMGALCHDLPIGQNGALANLLLCASDAATAKSMAPVGNVAFTDGSPGSDADFSEAFPYLQTPVAGSPN